MFTILEDKSQINSMQSMSVVVEGDNPEQVVSRQVADAVVKYAASQGFPVGGLNGFPVPSYPVDAKGELTDDVMLGKTPINAWRADYIVNGKIGF